MNTTSSLKCFPHAGFVLWFTGLSGAGKTTLATRIHHRLREHDARAELLDGDIVRTNLSKGLGFSREDRDTNVRRIGFVCDLLARNGVIAIASAISPFRTVREELRSRLPNFVEVYVECPLNVVAERDVKGLYKKALAGEIANFTGVSDPYEPPITPEIRVRTDSETPAECENRIWDFLRSRALIDPGVSQRMEQMDGALSGSGLPALHT